MFLFGDKTILEIIIWLTLTLSMLVLLISAIVICLIKNRGTDKKIFTTKKITIFATFLAILMIQTAIDVYMPNLPGMPSFESATTITIGFMFGVVEGVTFGWIADTTIVLMHGWTYQILPALMMPMIGMMAGLVRVFYDKSINKEQINESTNSEAEVVALGKGKKSNFKIIVVFQSIVITMMLLMLITSTTLITVIGNTKYDELQIIAPITCVVTIVLMEIIFYYLMYKGTNDNDLKLLIAALCVAILERTLEITVRPFSQHYYYSINYFVEFYIRILRSSYLIPSVTIASFVLIRTATMVIDL